VVQSGNNHAMQITLDEVRLADSFIALVDDKIEHVVVVTY